MTNWQDPARVFADYSTSFPALDKSTDSTYMPVALLKLGYVLAGLYMQVVASSAGVSIFFDPGPVVPSTF
jgi:hypothetical protein